MLDLTPVFRPAAPQTLCALSARAGLPLSARQAEALLAHQERTLLDLGRVDFSGGILPKLMAAFADSPYALAEDWPDTLAALTEVFGGERCDALGLFKSETRDAMADDNLLLAMRRLFDGACGGSAEALADCRAGDLFAALSKEDAHEE